MQKEVNLSQNSGQNGIQVISQPSVCAATAETQRLLKLFEILIKIDKRLKKLK